MNRNKALILYWLWAIGSLFVLTLVGNYKVKASEDMPAHASFYQDAVFESQFH